MSYEFTTHIKSRNPHTPKGTFLCPNGGDYATHITSLILDKTAALTDVEIYPLVYGELFNTALNYDVDNKPTFLIITLKRYGHSFIHEQLLPTNIAGITATLLEHKNKLLGGLEIYTDTIFTDTTKMIAKMKSDQTIFRSERAIEYSIIASRRNE